MDISIANADFKVGVISTEEVCQKMIEEMDFQIQGFNHTMSGSDLDAVKSERRTENQEARILTLEGKLAKQQSIRDAYPEESEEYESADIEYDLIASQLRSARHKYNKGADAMDVVLENVELLYAQAQREVASNLKTVLETKLAEIQAE